jgi:SAM-dependent methyltransferase
MAQALYDQIGGRYTSTRRTDPRIAAAILDALGAAGSVVNVGAGAGAYEPVGQPVVAVEPSRHMIDQRVRGAARVVQASAEALPFQAGRFDAALAVLTLHHWSDWRAGLDEMQRVATRVVVFAFEPRDIGNFWLTRRTSQRSSGSIGGGVLRWPTFSTTSGIAGWNTSPCRTIARMDSSPPSGAGRRRTSIRRFGRACPPSRCSTRRWWRAASRSSVPISNRARGSSASATSAHSTRSMCAIDS